MKQRRTDDASDVKLAINAVVFPLPIEPASTITLTALLSVKVPEVARCSHDYDPHRAPHPVAAGRVAHLAAQQKLGILPKRWSRIDPADSLNSSARRENLNSRHSNADQASHPGGADPSAHRDFLRTERAGDRWLTGKVGLPRHVSPDAKRETRDAQPRRSLLTARA
jgi:hypothetical protein